MLDNCPLENLQLSSTDQRACPAGQLTGRVWPTPGSTLLIRCFEESLFDTTVWDNEAVGATIFVAEMDVNLSTPPKVPEQSQQTL